MIAEFEGRKVQIPKGYVKTEDGTYINGHGVEYQLVIYGRDENEEEPFSLDDIVVGDVLGDDDRIGWKKVRHVCVKRYFDKDYIKEYGSPQCIGWCGE